MGLPDPPQPTNVREIVERWLKENGFDGLWLPGGCHCLLGEDYALCSAPHMYCEPVKRFQLEDSGYISPVKESHET